MYTRVNSNWLYLLFFIFWQFLMIIQVEGQAKLTDINKLKTKSDEMLGGGVVCIALGSVFMVIGTRDLALGNETITSTGGSYLGTIDHKTAGTVLTPLGIVFIGGGLPLLIFGTRLRHQFELKKLHTKLDIGYLSNAGAGMTFTFNVSR